MFERQYIIATSQCNQECVVKTLFVQSGDLNTYSTYTSLLSTIYILGLFACNET